MSGEKAWIGAGFRGFFDLSDTLEENISQTTFLYGLDGVSR
jgi:hypothetical protein